VVGVLIASITLLIGGLGLFAAISYASIARQLPLVGEIEHVLGSPGSEGFSPTLLYDRTGEILLLELMHPLASERRWLSLDPGSMASVPQSVVEATLAAQDPGFWQNPGFEPRAVVGALLTSQARRRTDPLAYTITQQLAKSTLMPLTGGDPSNWAHVASLTLLSARLTEQYPKEQLLEWYLNSAYYGNMAYGFDAAALVYFGKHASDLTLAECAMLAPIPSDTSANPVDHPLKARANQEATIAAMLDQGMIDADLAQDALSETLVFRSAQEVRAGLWTTGFEGYALRQLEALLGANFALRGGLKVFTTLDVDLQLQAECVGQTHLRRMQGEGAAVVQPASDGSRCEAALLLPTLRPIDIGTDHGLTDYAVVLLDPVTGEILSLAESRIADWSKSLLETPRAAGSAFTPFIYLTAFARGYAPGSMTLDIPTSIAITEVDREVQIDPGDGEYHGPVRMRIAMANAYEAAAVRTLALVGVENVLNTAHQMGLNTLDDPELDYEPMLALGSGEVTLIDMAYAYGVMANQGQMVGLSVPAETRRPGFRALDPVAILRVEDSQGSELYRAEPALRSVLSRELAYLMTHALSDEAARWPRFGQPNPMEIGRPAGVVAGITGDGRDYWTVGFTPSRVAGVWVGNLQDQALGGVDALNGATPIWHAILSHAVSDLPREAWAVPAGINQMEVCDPSGLLPTHYCPDVVREVFVMGTEPTSYDDLYQPFLVNKETGKLATLFTPLGLVREEVYLIPPPEAAEWAQQVGLEQPPNEYDAIYDQPMVDPEVNIRSPAAFDYVHGGVLVVGDARKEGMAYYRLQYGQGLNPTRWIQIGEDVVEPVEDDVLGIWNTGGLNGLYTLQLMVVLEDGRVTTAAVPATIDNQPPVLWLLQPQPNQVVRKGREGEIRLEAEASDELGVMWVEFYVDGERIAQVGEAPYIATWALGATGEYNLFVRAYDKAGNLASTDPITIEVIP
jgi:membrane carboxypeptidase/penicillin-binding protein